MELLNNYKVKSDTETYFAVCFFVRDVIHLRKYAMSYIRVRKLLTCLGT